MSGEEAQILSRREGTTGILTLSHPRRRNAFPPEMRRELFSRLVEYSEDPEVRAIVITGADGHFSVGADLDRMRGREAMPLLGKRRQIGDTHAMIRFLRSGPKPVIAAIEGDAFGGGLSIALACDFIVAARSARIGTGFVKLGLLPDMGIMYLLPRRIGAVAARRMLMLGEPVSGERAHTLGLVDELAEEGDALGRALRFAAQFEDAAMLPLAVIKSVLAADHLTIEDVFRTEIDMVPIASGSDDSRERRRKFLERRNAPKD